MSSLWPLVLLFETTIWLLSYASPHFRLGAMRNKRILPLAAGLGTESGSASSDSHPCFCRKPVALSLRTANLPACNTIRGATDAAQPDPWFQGRPCLPEWPVRRRPARQACAVTG